MDVPKIISATDAYELASRGLQKKSKDLIDWITHIITKASDQGFFRVVVIIPSVIANMLEQSDYTIYREDSKYYAPTTSQKDLLYENGAIQKFNGPNNKSMVYVVCWDNTEN